MADTNITLLLLHARPNIKIQTLNSSENFEEELAWVMKKCKEEQASMGKVLLFCSTIDICQKIYNWLMLKLKLHAYKDSCVDIGNRLTEMFHRGTDVKTKDRIIQNYKQADSCLRVVVSTVAFGLGIDIPNVRHVIWGCPDTLLDMWQLFGRAGRDGEHAVGTVYEFPRSFFFFVVNADPRNVNANTLTRNI